MDKNKRKELLEEFKQIKTYMGVIQITNKVNRKIFVSGYPNLKNKWVTIQIQLDMGKFANLQLQKDWKEYGAEAFNYEVLEQKNTDDIFDIRWEVKQMEKRWFEKLQPHEDKGYHKPRVNNADKN
ncbi:GIY-YIG nuclease family protein [Paenibacillus sp.]|jgi:hypothetical protein|uniref:GIY-YIG nuclease family protein n=1 Tax=Paenibacillus sp. TaxID=58172 RepID=UPI00282553E7|nr:GIY-YIG nuclease family protein [Paenibacillus sp.]MDR0270678.1 GIY-YIG nuclease family protein [Paenibacillus sp.]